MKNGKSFKERERVSHFNYLGQRELRGRKHRKFRPADRLAEQRNVLAPRHEGYRQATGGHVVEERKVHEALQKG